MGAIEDSEKVQLSELALKKRLWVGSGSSTKVALMIRKVSNSTTDGWVVPPVQGLDFVVDQAQARALFRHRMPIASKLLYPLTVALERPADSRSEEATLKAQAEKLGLQVQYLHVYQQPAASMDTPWLIAPTTTDDLLSGINSVAL